ncbi:hypothetical protein DEO72_LG2g3328 [Vigna unguiculata]|uniref:Uncharacterized protein n=1 Tax=Vigna unguiculata TaxID=3917 RepID=A0A4D6L3C6_VIGUN|nr:hypothetical protein DEO72_LG2g3328 [Vigna unguiculata]
MTSVEHQIGFELTNAAAVNPFPLALTKSSARVALRSPSFEPKLSSYSLQLLTALGAVLPSLCGSERFASLNPRIVARPVNLAQASPSRLGEMKQGARLGFFARKVAQATRSTFERAGNSPKREGSRLSEIPRCSCSCFCALA